MEAWRGRPLVSELMAVLMFGGRVASGRLLSMPSLGVPGPSYDGGASSGTCSLYCSTLTGGGRYSCVGGDALWKCCWLCGLCCGPPTDWLLAKPATIGLCGIFRGGGGGNPAAIGFTELVMFAESGDIGRG
jgi:hypothetical protein